MATNNMHNLTTLIKRLEAATARLEDIASSTVELPQAVPALQQTLPTPQSGPSTASLPTVPAAAPKAATPAEPLPESIEEFDAFVESSVGKFVELSNKIGGVVAEQASVVLQGFKAQRRFLLISTKAKKPDVNGKEMAVYQELLEPIKEALASVNTIQERNRGSQFSDNLNAVSNGVMMMAWVTMDNRPWKHVDEQADAAKFYGNRVLKANKDKDPQQVEWIQAWYQLFRDLTEYLKQYFANGVTWNPKGLPAQEVAKTLGTESSSAAAPPPPPPAAGAPPPPPPPGPPPVLQINEQKAPPANTSGGIGAVFSELNKGEAVTAGLRKVDKSQMTHKNPALRAGSTVPERESSARGKSPVPGKKPKPESMRVKKPPKKELEGNKWMIENFEKEEEPIVIEASISHSILISKCSNTTVVIKGKANAVTIENTQRLSLICDSLVSSVDVVKSANFALQVLGNIPTVLMDQVDAATIYFSRESASTKVYTSKSSGVNLNVMAGEDEDYKELALPSQICSYFDEAKGEVVNEIVDHAG